ncbi:MAG: glutamate--cysteine ligase [Alphaproteobacteria bacterium]|nr:MAG: glutamate--cysteine ligase [Alphaproteobacteria bacterium]
MSVPQTGGGLIESRDDLVAFLEKGCKGKDKWLIGTEHEKFGFHTDTLTPLEYEGPRGIKAMLEGMQRFGWQPVMEGGNIIGLTMNGASISLEPGGQFELSGAPLQTIHQTCDEVHTHLAQVREVADEIGAGFLGLGISPKWTLDETPMMPKGRYQIMRNYMPKVGTRGLDMMFRSCTIQTNLDFGSEADMVKKFRVGLALQPVATALFANSPFLEGKPNGFLSYRSEMWKDVDKNRTGMLPFVFEEGFGFEAYVDYALDVPMYFVYREGVYHDVTGLSFRDFLAGNLKGFEGEMPTLSDWADHLTTIFPEVRIKQFMEVRGTDGGPWAKICALPALWVGLFYHQDALDAAYDMVKDWKQEERQALRDAVPQEGLAAKIRGRSVQDLARDVLEIATSGLEARGALDSSGGNEVHFLNTLKEVAISGRTPAEVLLEAFHGPWGGDIDPIFKECAY